MHQRNTTNYAKIGLISSTCPNATANPVELLAKTNPTSRAAVSGLADQAKKHLEGMPRRPPIRLIRSDHTRKCFNCLVKFNLKCTRMQLCVLFQVWTSMYLYILSCLIYKHVWYTGIKCWYYRIVYKDLVPLPSLQTRSVKSFGPSPLMHQMDSATSRELPIIFPRGESISVSMATVCTPEPFPARTCNKII